MKIPRHFLYFVFFLSFFSSCVQDKTDDGKVLCRINERNLPLVDFQRQLAEELELKSDFKLTQEAKRNFMEGLIRKELLIQEAKKLNLDRKDKFVKTIERYWESTLIRDLMDLKCEEINKRIYVSEEEIEARYQEIKEMEDRISPLSEIDDQVREALKEEKKTRLLEEWINDLRKKASVEINEDLL